MSVAVVVTVMPYRVHRRGLPAWLVVVSLTLVAGAEAAPSVTLAWDPNTEGDLAGYVVSYGTQSGAYSASIDVGNQTIWATNQLTGGVRYYFVVQAYSSSGLFSGYSNEVSAIAAYRPPAPTLTQISPSSGSTNGGTTLALTGSNFSSNMIVTIGGKPALNVVALSSTTMTATTPPGAAASVDVVVSNEEDEAVLANAFVYVSNVMTLSSVYPVTGLARGGTALMIRGTNFTANTTVTLGGVAATSVRVVGATLISATSPAHDAGAADVRIQAGNGQVAALAGGFTYVNGRPVASSVNPRKGSLRGGTLVTVAGSNFVDGTVVTFGGVPAAHVTVVSPTSITAWAPTTGLGGQGAQAAGPQVVDIVVTNPDGQTSTLSGAYTYDLVAPTVSSVSPSSGTTAGGTRVTIKGTEFDAGAVVLFGTAAATDVTLVNSTQLTAIVPGKASAGAVDVLVRNVDALQGVRQRGFTYVGSNTTLDTDHDGLPDLFEDQMGLDPNSATGDDGAGGDPDDDGLTNLTEFNGGTHPRGLHARYFAEGVTSTFFTTVFALANPGAETAHVLMRFMRGDGSQYSHAVIVGPNSRATIDGRSIAAIATAAFSTAIESDELVVADRTMSWDNTGYGAHAETAISAPAQVWYLAEGATHSGFDLFYLVQNPHGQDARIQVRYLLPVGEPIEKTYVVPANSRFNIWVDLEHSRLAQTDVSGVVTSTNGVPVIVERSMYMNAGGRPFGAGHNSAGVSAPATRWFLAEGATGQFFDEFVLVANPEHTPANVRASFMLPNGDTVERSYTVPPESRFNIWVDLEDPALASSAVSTEIESTNGVPIIVERTMWWPGPSAAQWAEAHNSAGASTTATRWALAEGEVGGSQGRETFILLANASPYAGSAKVTLLFQDGSTSSKVFPLVAKSRLNVAVATDFPLAANRRFGALIESLGDSPAELVVERAMYWNANNQYWAAGTNALGTPLP